MTRLFKRQMYFWARTIWGTALFLIISLAVVVQLGRTVFPLLNDYQEEIEEQLSVRLGVQVEVGNITAEWTGLRPRITFADVSVRNLQGETVFSADTANAEVSLLSSIKDWRLGFRRIRFNGLAATLAQNQAGRWWVQGLTRKTGGEQPLTGAAVPQLSDPMDIFLFGRRVELNQTRLVLLFRSGLTTDIAVPHIRLENDTQFHRLKAAFAVDEGEQALDLVVEASGNPRDEAGFETKGYLRLQDFPSEKVLAVFGIGSDLLIGKDGSDGQDAWYGDGRVNMSLWFGGSAARGVTMVGEVDLKGSPLRPPEGVEWPQSLQGKISGGWDSKKGWQVGLYQARLVWSEFISPSVDLSLVGGLADDTELTVASIDVAAWSEVLSRAGAFRGRLADVMGDIQPRGELFNIHIVPRPAERGHFVLRANVRDGSVEAWQGAPALNGVNGYVEASAWGGEIRLSTERGFSMSFPRLFHESLAFNSAHGAVSWVIDLSEGHVGVASSVVHLANDDVAATGHFHLRLPVGERLGNEDPELTLVIGAKEGSAGMHRQLVPYIVPQPVLDWLDRAVVAGTLRDVGFIYHGSLAKEPTTARIIQLHARVREGEVAFDPNWPPLTQAAGSLYLDGEKLYIKDLQGRLGGVQVDRVQVQLVRLDEEERGVRVQGALAADSRAAVDLLMQSPLRNLGGEELSSWRLQGPMVGEVDLLVPFDADHPAAYQNIKLHFSSNRLEMPNKNLTFEELSGPLEFDSAKGLSSAGLRGHLWGQPATAALRTEATTSGKEIVAELAGTVSIADVREWSGRPELAFASGVSEAAGELRIPMYDGGTVKMFLASSLEGVTLNAPPPFYKSADSSLPLQILLEHRPDQSTQRFRFVLPDLAELLVINRDDEVHAVDLALGSIRNESGAGAANEIVPGVVRIHGHVAQADAIPWRVALEQLTNLYTQQPSEAREPAGTGVSTQQRNLPIQLNLRLGHLQAGDLLLENLRVTGGNEGGLWRIGLEHPTLVGTVTLPEGDRPMNLQLDRLYLPAEAVEATQSHSPEADSSEIVAQIPDLENTEDGEPSLPPSPPSDFWQTLDLAAVPPMDIQIQDLRKGDTHLGRWEMKLRPIDKGLLAYDLIAKTAGLTISGRGKTGAELVWLRTPTGNSSYFSGLVKGRDLADTFRHLGLDPALTSDNAAFDVDLQWEDVPPRFTLAQLAGVVNMSIERGVFARGGAAGENPLLKLIGLLNFDTLARRLRLDFSDLSSTGLAYETIQGSLLFRAGSINIRDPLQVETPSSHLQLVGDLDVTRETLDAQLVATLPLAGNLTVAAAITGGVPLAIGVYVAGKVFKNQVDRVSSLRYKVTGPWADPKAKLEKIFENSVTEPARAPDKSGGGLDGE